MRRGQTTSILIDARGVARAIAVPAWQLRVLRGPDKGRERRFALRRALIGGGEGADFRLTDDTVSAVHCEIVLDEKGARVRDLGARNGVLLQDRRVTDAFLEAKDELVLGGTVLRFKLLDEVEELPLEAHGSLGRMRGASPVMRELYGLLRKAAQADVPVLLTGETGTGKELAAEAIVGQGPRAELPLVVLDCGRLTATLAESELFGHERGAFTGASERRIGALEQAGRGTLFIDEVGELPLELQPKLLGVLERKWFTRVGGQERIPFEARVIAATHRPLEREVNRGTFRADLFYRLAVAQLRLPALRERPEDIPELVATFLEELPGAHRLPPAATERLYRGDYPGNVRELRAAVERAVIGLEPPAEAVRPDRIDLELPFRIQKERLVEGFERAYLQKLLEATSGNVSEAARRSGLNRVHLHEMLRRHGVTPRR